MKSRVRWVFLIILCSVWAVHAGEPVAEPTAKAPIPAITDIEAQYFKLRDKLCLSKAVKRGDARPLEALKKPTMDIIGPVKVEGFSGEGKLAIEPDYDAENPCDTLDGLYFFNASEGLHVTTSSLLVNYSARHPEQGKRSSAPTSMEDLYALSSDPDVDSDLYTQIPVRTTKGQNFAYASLYGEFSDIGPYLPDHISVVVWVGNRRFTLSAPAKEKVPDIPECDKVWEEFAARSGKADETYQEATSNGKQIQDRALDERMKHASGRIREQGFAAFKACYRKTALEKSLFVPFVGQAQALVDRVKADYPH